MRVVFQDRRQAAEQLAGRLAVFQAERPLILGIPRGGIVMGTVIAQALGGDLDVALVRKIGLPSYPEMALGALDEDGRLSLDRDGSGLGVSREALDAEISKQAALLRERREAYSRVRPPIEGRSRTVLVVDDGVATGSTMLAAVRMARARGVARVVAAAGVMSPRAVQRLAKEADEVVYLDAPEDFMAVGQFFEHFEPVSNEEVLQLLAASTSNLP